MKRNRTAAEVYEDHAMAIRELVDDIGEAFMDAYPAPDQEESVKYNWSTVGDLAEIRKRLESVLAFIKGKEE